MAGGQVITSEQGSVTQSATIALVGLAIAVSAGTLVASSADAEMVGAEAALSAGTAASAMLVPLRSRKVGGGAASRALIGNGVTSGQTAPSVLYAKTPTGQAATLSQGSVTKTTTVALTGSAVTVGAGIMSSGANTFPLSIHASRRYLVSPSGTPFLIHGDTAWSIVAQLTNAQIDTYLNDRSAKGFTAILFSAPEAFYTSQTPSYNNVDGVAPFSPATSFTNPVEAYWTRVDYLVNGAKARGMVCIFNPCYLGFTGGSDGWRAAMTAVSDANLQAYGVFLANRYTQGNVIWCMGGDEDQTTPITKQFNIMTGIRSVRTSDLWMGHPLADAANADDGWTYWNGFTSFSANGINTAYGWPANGWYPNALLAQAYGRAGPVPAIGFEFQYEGEGGPPNIGAQQIRYQSYGAILSGGCGQLYGNSPVWHFDSSRAPYADSTTWPAALNSTGAQQQVYVKALFSAVAWWRLQPQTGTGLVTTSLGSGANRVYPALASDASFAMVYIPTSQTITVNMASLTLPSVRSRLYDPTTGIYSTVSGSPFPASGTRNFASGGETILVLDSSALDSPTIAFAWDAVSGSILGYRLYFGSASGVYDGAGSPIFMGNVTSYTIPNPGTSRYYVVKVVHASGTESAASTEMLV